MHHETPASPQVQALHPLRAAAMAAEEVLREARAKVDMLARDERLSSSAPAWLEALGAEAAADDALDAVRATLSGSDCPRVWIVSEQHADMCFHREVTATSPRGAIEAALRDVGRGTESLRVHCRETGECMSMNKTRTTRIDL